MNPQPQPQLQPQPQPTPLEAQLSDLLTRLDTALLANCQPSTQNFQLNTL